MSDLRKAKRAAAKAAVAHAALEDAIRELHAEGVSLRKIAEVAGMSHTQVARIVQRDESQRCSDGVEDLIGLNVDQ